MEYHAKRYYVGSPCEHCGATNTVADCYRYDIEGNCLSCATPWKLSEEQHAHYWQLWKADV